MDLPSQIKNAIACGWHTNHEPEQVDVILKNGIILRLKSISSFPTLIVSSLCLTSIKVAPVARNGLPSSSGTCLSSSMSITTKSTGKINFPTLISTSSKIHSG